MSSKSKAKIDWFNHLISLVVVFLGVTAGFILQNKKESSLNRSLEDKYLANFIADVEENISSLHKAILNDSLWISSNSYALNEISNNSLSFDSACQIVKSMLFLDEFKEQSVTYENMINSGNLNLISNYKLKQQIVSYHKRMDDFQMLNTVFKDYVNITFMPFIIKNFDVFKEKFNDPTIHKKIEFRNIFGAYFIYKQQMLDEYKDMVNKSEEFKSLLEK